MIVFNDNQCTMRCHILEVSDTGAKLVPADPLLCPKEFVLKPKIGPARECEVVWRKGTQIGIRYITQPASITIQTSSGRELVVFSREAPAYSPDTVHERAVLEQAIDEIITQNKDRERSAAFLVVSILNMIAIANVHGKAIIEPVLLDTAWRLRACLRASDIIGRLSDHTLGVVLPSVRDYGTAVVADKIRALDSTLAKTVAGPVDIKIGVEYVLFPTDGLTAAELINRMQGQTALARYAGRRSG
jgi:GGDEF domain-containing protein